MESIAQIRDRIKACPETELAALLAEYAVRSSEGESLEDYLDRKVFAGMKQMTVEPDPDDEAGFDRYMESFMRCIPAQKAAVEGLKA